MNKTGSQAKHITYAAHPLCFVHSESILGAFNKIFGKKFDRKITRGLAFESDEIFSVSERILRNRIGTFRVFGTWGTLNFKSRKQAVFVHEGTKVVDAFFTKYNIARGAGCIHKVRLKPVN